MNSIREVAEYTFWALVGAGFFVASLVAGRVI